MTSRNEPWDDLCLLEGGIVAYIKDGKYMIPVCDVTGSTMYYETYDHPPWRVLSPQEAEVVLDHQPLTRTPAYEPVPRARPSTPSLVDDTGPEVQIQEEQLAVPVRQGAVRTPPIAFPLLADARSSRGSPRGRGLATQSNDSASSRTSSRSRTRRVMGEISANVAPAPASTPADASYRNDRDVEAVLSGAIKALTLHKAESPKTPPARQ